MSSVEKEKEIEQLAYRFMVASLPEYARTSTVVAELPLNCFHLAEIAIAERDKRREAVKP